MVQLAKESLPVVERHGMVLALHLGMPRVDIALHQSGPSHWQGSEMFQLSLHTASVAHALEDGTQDIRCDLLCYVDSTAS